MTTFELVNPKWFLLLYWAMETDVLSLKKNGGSLYFRLPAYHVHKHGLKPGDRYEFISNADGTLLRFLRVEGEDLPPQVDGRRRQEASVAAE
jgi:hypothetical protein